MIRWSTSALHCIAICDQSAFFAKLSSTGHETQIVWFHRPSNKYALFLAIGLALLMIIRILLRIIHICSSSDSTSAVCNYRLTRTSEVRKFSFASTWHHFYPSLTQDPMILLNFNYVYLPQETRSTFISELAAPTAAVISAV